MCVKRFCPTIISRTRWLVKGFFGFFLRARGKGGSGRNNGKRRARFGGSKSGERGAERQKQAEQRAGAEREKGSERGTGEAESALRVSEYGECGAVALLPVKFMPEPTEGRDM